MKQSHSRYVCQNCGHVASRWVGQCPSCEAWGTVEEEKPRVLGSKRGEKAAPAAVPLSHIDRRGSERIPTGFDELDRLLGGGLVPGSVVLVGGEPGIGKSTLLLQCSTNLANQLGGGIYFSGEESAQQIRLRADRLGLESDNLLVVCDTDLAALELYLGQHEVGFLVVDSIQTVRHPDFESSAGTVGQVRECAAYMTEMAKSRCLPAFLVGHVTKEGSIAGPKLLEHLVDTVLYFEGERTLNFRIIRAAKNRFGSTDETALFRMTDAGLEEVTSPSQFLLEERDEESSGSVVVPVMEGTRPMLLEVQALVSPTYFGTPRRVVTGTDYNRCAVLLAVLEKRAGVQLSDQDVMVNVVGGMRIAEPAADLAVALAAASSYRDRRLAESTVVFGEVGLGGEVRAVSHADRRVLEAARLGFSQCILPQSDAERVRQNSGLNGFHLLGVRTLNEALEAAMET